jgi:hypothetical protein
VTGLLSLTVAYLWKRNMMGSWENDCDLVNVTIVDSLFGAVTRPRAEQPRDRGSIPGCS